MIQIYRPTPPIQWDWLTLRGADAADFLHRLTTVNVRAMQPGEGSPGLFLTAQGKIRAYFRLWRISSEEFFLEFNAGMTGQWKKELQNVIEQFHFGEKFTVETAPEQKPELVCAWIFGEETEQFAPTGRLREVEPGVRVFNHGSIDYGTPWLTAWGAHSALDTWVRSLGAQLIGFERIEQMRIAMARPRVDFELSSETIPLDAGMREAISDNKGCYPGQEVIEKIVSLGSPARRLARIEGKGPVPTAGQAIFAAGAAGAAGTSGAPGAAIEVGRLTSVIAVEGGFQALGFVRKTHAREGLEVRFDAKFDAQAAPSARIAFVPDYKTGARTE